MSWNSHEGERSTHHGLQPAVLQVAMLGAAVLTIFPGLNLSTCSLRTASNDSLVVPQGRKMAKVAPLTVWILMLLLLPLFIVETFGETCLVCKIYTPALLITSSPITSRRTKLRGRVRQIRTICGGKHCGCFL